jgi:carboxyl-terminal processing protease
MLKKRSKLLLVTLLITVALFFLLEKDFLPGLFSQSVPPKPFEILGWVIKLIKDDYVEVPDPSKTMDGAYKGLVDSLDALSSYLDKESVIRYQARMQGPFQETGVVLFKRYRSFPMIIGIKENSPAEKAELKLGTPVYALDGMSTLKMSMLEIALLLKSKEATPVEFKLDRGSENEIVNLDRVQLHEQSYAFSEAEGVSGILKLNSLYPPLVDRIKQDILAQLKNTTKPLILDLRNCNEGTLPEAISVINLFLKKDDIGYLEKTEGEKQQLACSDAPELPNIPLIIWTNQATMGPSEMVASVLHEFRDAKVVGAQTLGLVAQQQFFALEDGSGLVLTSAIYYPASKEEFWEKGLMPDVKIKAENQNTDAYLEESRKLTSKT